MEYRRPTDAEKQFSSTCDLVVNYARRDENDVDMIPTLGMIADDLGSVAHRLLELDSESLRVAYWRAEDLNYHLRVTQRSRYKDYGIRLDKQSYLTGAAHAIAGVLSARLHETDRVEKRERHQPYIHCFMAIVDELQEYTAMEFYQKLHQQTLAIAQAADDQEFIWSYDEDYSSRLLFDLVNLLTSSEHQRFNQKLQNPTRRLKEGAT